MALSDKNIVITPNIGATDDPKIVFSGADASTAAQDITLYTYPTSNGTVSFEGSAGQLFSITNDLTGTIFSVNDVSGIPSIEVDADGTVKLAEFGGNVLIGTSTDNGTDLLQVNGSVATAGNLLLDADNAEINLKSGATGTNGAVNWTFNTDTTNYASLQLPYDTRATTGFHIDSGYPITVDATTQINFAISGTTGMRYNSSGLSIGSEVVLSESADRADLLQISSTTSGWGGLQIRNSSNEGRWSFMTDGEVAGIYNDEDNQWHIQMTEAAGVTLYYAAVSKLQTTSTGANVSGTLTATAVTANLNTSTADGTNKVGYRNVPPVGTKTTSYTLAVGDVGKYVQLGTGGAITIPNGVFSEGDAISIFNNTSGDRTITCSITTAYIAGTDGDVASVTLLARGVCTILFISSTVCVISGTVA